MGSRLVMRPLGVGLLGVVFLALPLMPLTTTGSVVAYAAEKADFLDINTATAEQRKGAPWYWRGLHRKDHHCGEAEVTSPIWKSLHRVQRKMSRAVSQGGHVSEVPK